MGGICGFCERKKKENLTEQALNEALASLESTAQSLSKGYTFNTGVFIERNTHLVEVDIHDQIKLIVYGHPYIENLEQENHSILDLYQTMGLEMFTFLKGDFALVIVDQQAGQIILAVDRLGIQPLAYTLQNDRVYFSSTLDEIKALVPQKLDVSQQSIYHYLYYHMIPSPGTIYKDVAKLQPAQCVVIKADSVNSHFYWQPQFEENHSSTIDQFSEELRSLMSASVGRCLSDKPTGAFLSGGLDSSTVSGFLSKNLPDDRLPARTYSIGFDAKGYDEIEFARITAKAFNLDANEYYVTPDDVYEAILKIADAYDEPYGNSSAIPAFYCATFAKADGIDTLLAGDGGDELFAGNDRYAKQLIFEQYNLVPESLRKYLVEPLAGMIPKHLPFAPLRKIRSYVDQAKVPLPARLETYNFFHRKPLNEIMTTEFAAAINPDGPIQLMNDTYNIAGYSTCQNKMLFLDWKQTLADNDLRKVNKMCELAGINVRYPMLDDDLLEFSTKIPSDLKIKGKQLRYFFKYAMTGFLPDQIINKPKQGFGLPFGVWLTTSEKLQEMAYDSLSDHKKRGYLQPEFIDWLLDKHRHEHAAFYGTLVWVIMMLEIWLKLHVD